MASIRLSKLGKTYGNGVEAIKELSLEVADGEFMVVLGPSGCGKSTLLRLIAGLETPTTGEIVIGADCVNATSARARDVAMVSQSFALYPHLTVRENLEFPLRMRKHSRAQIQSRVDQAVSRLALTGLLDALPHELSGGQQQRVAIGRALVRSPSVFLLDEPLSNLDTPLRVQLRREIAELQREARITTIYVTHDQAEAMALGQRLCVLSTGAMQQVGTAQAVYKQPANAFVAAFLGNPGMNLLPASVAASDSEVCIRLGSRVWTVGESLLRKYPRLRLESAQAVLVGIRPEALALVDGSAEFMLEGTVQATEYLGAEQFVYLCDCDVGLPRAAENNQEAEIPLVARLSAETMLQTGVRVKLAVAGESLRLFDGAGLAW